MCYSAMIEVTKKEYFKYHNLEGEDSGVFNQRVFPHGLFPVVAQREGQLQVQEMNYSLIPAWSKQRKPKFATYNARVETIAEKPTWKSPLESRRCLVSFTGFFESCYEGTHHGKVVKFSNKNGGLMTAAGLWDQWVDKETGELVDSFAIITRGPSEQLKEVGHDRSPFFINSQAWSEWLCEEKLPAKKAIELLKSSACEYKFEPEVERTLKGYS